MIICGAHSDEKAGIMTIVDLLRIYALYWWSSEHQDYDCNTLSLAMIFENESLSYYRVSNRLVSLGDRQCITVDQSLWTMDQVLVTNVSQMCELCVSMVRNMWYWFYQIHVDKRHNMPQLDQGPVSLTVFPSQFKFDGNSFHSHLNSNTVIAIKYCSWHDSCAVVACAKICCDLIASNGITARRSFHRIWIAGKKSLVKRAPESTQFLQAGSGHILVHLRGWSIL